MKLEMKLPQLIRIIMDSSELTAFYQKYKLNTDSEELLIYLANSLNLESDIYIFETEETDGDLVFEKDGIEYHELFSIDYTIELIESDLDLMNKGYTSLQIAKRLLEYRIKDA